MDTIGFILSANPMGAVLCSIVLGYYLNKVQLISNTEQPWKDNDKWIGSTDYRIIYVYFYGAFGER